MATKLKQAVYDEISLVDIPANQESRVLITKRADEKETAVADALAFDSQDVEEVDIADLQVGDIVLDANNEPVEITEAILDELDELAGEEQHEPELVGVGKAFTGPTFTTQVQSLISKALSEGTTEDALVTLAKAADDANARAQRAEEIAKREYDTRVEREYIGRAAEYGLPVDPAVLGPVMKRAQELLPESDCRVLNEVFTTAGQLAQVGFDEIGKGSGYNSDPFGIVAGLIDSAESFGGVAKNDKGGVDLVATLDQNPDLYDAYEADVRSFGRGA